MSALPLKADITENHRDVRLVPPSIYSITLFARPNEIGTVMPSALAVLRLMISSIFARRSRAKRTLISDCHNSLQRYLRFTNYFAPLCCFINNQLLEFGGRQWIWLTTELR